MGRRRGRPSKRSGTASDGKESGGAAQVPSNPRQSTSSPNVDAAPLSRQPDSPATRAKTEKRASTSGSPLQTPSNFGDNADSPSPSGSSPRPSGSPPRPSGSPPRPSSSPPRPPNSPPRPSSSPRPSESSPRHVSGSRKTSQAESKIDDTPRSKTQNIHSTPSSPRSVHQSVPSPAGDVGESSIPEASTKIDDTLPRSNAGDMRSRPSSPRLAHQSVSSPGGDVSGPSVPEVTRSDSPKSSVQRLSPPSRQPELPATHATHIDARLEEHSSLTPSPQTPSSPNCNPDIPLSASGHRPSGSEKTSPESQIARALPRSTADGAHSMPSSPEQTYQSVPSPAIDRNGPALPETTPPGSPKSPILRGLRSRLQKRKPNAELDPDPVDVAESVSLLLMIRVAADPAFPQ
jgi:hypothetical protein